MSTAACILMVFGFSVTWGGAAVCITLAIMADRSKENLLGVDKKAKGQA